MIIMICHLIAIYVIILLTFKKIEIKNNDNDKKKNDKYKEIDSYKPTGNLIYQEDLFKKMQIN